MTCPCKKTQEIGTSNNVDNDFLPILSLDIPEKIDLNYNNTNSTKFPNDELEDLNGAGEPFPHDGAYSYGKEPIHEPYLAEMVPCDTYCPVQEIWISRVQESQVFDESKHPRASDGRFGSKAGSDGNNDSDTSEEEIFDRAAATAMASLEQERDQLVKRIQPESQEYAPFEKVSDEDRGKRWQNKEMRAQIEKVEQRMKDMSPIEGAPILPRGKNTHPHDPRGFRNNQTTNIRVYEPKANDPPYAREVHRRQVETLKTMWNELPDEERDSIKEFEIAPVDMEDYTGGGITMGYFEPATNKVWLGTTRHSDTQEIRGTFVHEIAHSRWHAIKDKNPEKIKQFMEDVKGFPSSSKYSKYHASKIKYYNKKVARWEKAKAFAVPNASWGEKAEKTYQTVQKNMKFFTETYYNELHSELQMHVMGMTKQEGKKGSRKIPKSLTTSIKAYKRLHDIE
jgi:hypothetical protein